jgi:hypothetical protein
MRRFHNTEQEYYPPKIRYSDPFSSSKDHSTRNELFTVIEDLKGYHQVLLDDESAALTTFSTPFGRYQYLRLPFSVMHAVDDYTVKTVTNISGV